MRELETKFEKMESKWSKRLASLEDDAEILAEVPIKTLAGDIVAFIRERKINENPTAFGTFLHDAQIKMLAGALRVHTVSLAWLCHGCHSDRNEVAHCEDIELLRIRVRKLALFFLRCPSLKFKFRKQHRLIMQFEHFDNEMQNIGWY